MKKEEAKKKPRYEFYLGKNVRILLSNNFSYTGEVLEVNEDSLVILDKYKSKVTFHTDFIMIISEVNTDGDQ